jgi:hypothetical protein
MASLDGHNSWQVLVAHPHAISVAISGSCVESVVVELEASAALSDTRPTKVDQHSNNVALQFWLFTVAIN